MKCAVFSVSLNLLFCRLVCPYFISTGMFKGVKNKYQWLMPIIEPQDMADRIVKGMRQKYEN